MNKEIEKYLNEHAVTIDGIRSMRRLTEKERKEKYGKHWRLLISKYISHKNKIRTLWENKINENKRLVEEAKRLSREMEIPGW